MTSKNKITYIATNIFPSKAANNIHIFNICTELFKMNMLERLVIRGNYIFQNRLRSEAGIKKIFSQMTEFDIKFLPNTRGLKGNLFSLILSFFLRKIENKNVYTRSLEVAFKCVKRNNVIIEIHAPPNNEREKKYLKELIKENIKIVVISNALKKHLVNKWEAHPERITVLPDASTEIVFSKQELEIYNQKYQQPIDVCYVGHLYKGRADIIPEIGKLNQKLKIKIIGGNKKDIEFLKSKSTKNVEFLGHVPYKEARYLMNNSKILLAPYNASSSTEHGIQTSEWLSPLKIFEYMQSKSIIIASELPVLKEVLNQKNAIFCNIKSTETWEEKITEILNNYSDYLYLAENAYIDSKKYTWQKRAEKIIHLYDR